MMERNRQRQTETDRNRQGENVDFVQAIAVTEKASPKKRRKWKDDIELGLELEKGGKVA